MVSLLRIQIGNPLSVVHGAVGEGMNYLYLGERFLCLRSTSYIGELREPKRLRGSQSYEIQTMVVTICKYHSSEVHVQRDYCFVSAKTMSHHSIGTLGTHNTA